MTSLDYILQRYSANDESTLGLLLLPSARGLVLQAYTLEDELRLQKVPGETRIPAGRYALRFNQALTPLTQKYRARFSWFEWHVELVDVPGFSNVYVHIGNTDDDTDGCILLGDVANNNRVGTGFISASEQAYRRWYHQTANHIRSGGSASLDVRDELRLAA